ncbi:MULTISPECIES: class I SAM-dependent methyltransferase [Paenibacillus]|uniref:class I SAM-dependent methyltransferase n=1 Tax=Paenibacillus TaxID=44249 RepID=UPI0022B85C05|nr:methyltransferase domain-containing protein [Paenibacillus caseinilyticus]MCZ8518059.1 methyltransferase domain-containing protein [Paenibacillus caseinilyticus]
MTHVNDHAEKKSLENKDTYEQTGVAMTCRSFDEYLLMFSLNSGQLEAGPILDVASGASSFVAEASCRGLQAAAADPLYAMTAEEISEHGRVEIDVSTEKLGNLQHRFDWSYYGGLDRHRAMREASLQRFSEDFAEGKESGRYVPALLPHLPYEADSFSLVLCSHFLFLYQDQFDYDFHLEAVKELLRVCRPGGEVRIYPVYSLKWERYADLERLMKALGEEGAEVSLVASNLPFIPGSEELLRLCKPSS